MGGGVVKKKEDMRQKEKIKREVGSKIDNRIIQMMLGNGDMNKEDGRTGGGLVGCMGA